MNLQKRIMQKCTLEYLKENTISQNFLYFLYRLKHTLISHTPRRACCPFQSENLEWASLIVISLNLGVSAPCNIYQLANQLKIMKEVSNKLSLLIFPLKCSIIH